MSGGALSRPSSFERKDLETLDRLPRPERIRRLWFAMSPHGREAAWAALGEDDRVDVVRYAFKAREVKE